MTKAHVFFLGHFSAFGFVPLPGGVVHYTRLACGKKVGVWVLLEGSI